MNVMNEIEKVEKDVLTTYENLALLRKNPTHLSAKIHEAVIDLKSSLARLETLEDKLYTGRVS